MSYLGNSPGVASQRIVTTFTATAGQTTFTPSSGYALGYCDVFLNGVKLVNGDDYTAANGTTVVLASGASAGDSVEVVAFIPRGLSDGYTKAEADALLAQKLALAGGTMTGKLTVTKNSTISTTDFYASDTTLKLSATGANQIAGIFLDSQGPNGGRAAAAVFAEPVASDSWRSTLVNVYTADGSIGGYAIRQFNPSAAATYDRLKIDSAGRITMPYQPAFRVSNASGLSVASTGVIVFSHNTYNPQGIYNASNGRFTAPVSGRYQFNLVVRTDSLPSTAQYWRVRPHLNGSHMEWLIGDAIRSQAESGVTYTSTSMSWMIELNAGDYIDCRMDNASGASMSISNSGWSGYLIG